MENDLSDTTQVSTANRADQILEDLIFGLARRTDLLFVWLMLVEYTGAIAAAAFYAPVAWSLEQGMASACLWATVALGGVITLVPAGMVINRPGNRINRYVIAGCQMLLCGMLIHLTAGRSESFLLIYFSLALLSFYRTLLVVMVASAFAIVELLFWGSYWTTAIAGGWSEWRMFEHCGWVVFLDVFLISGIDQIVAEWRAAARRLAELEGENIGALTGRAQKDKELQARLARLSEQGERMTAILERSYEAFIAIDSDGRITDWNKQAERTLGWSAPEVLGLQLGQVIIPPAYRDAYNQSLKKLNEAGESQVGNRSIEAVALHRDGHEFPVELSVTAIRIGPTLSICAFLRDITDRRRLIDELALARDRAQAASRSKSQFVANISHEIRTPMNGIIGMATILLKSSLNKKQFEHVNTIRDAGNSLLTIINDILDLSKIEAEKVELESIAFSPTDLIEHVGELLASQAEAKGLSVMTFIAPQIPAELHGDRERLKQVLINLTGNAIKFSERGRVVISATLESESEHEVVVRFSVSDTGVGISEEERASLFQPFVQADGTISRKYGGTGLGLSISQRLVDLMGGTIRLESVKGQGSTFWFNVPFSRPGSAAPHVRHSHENLKNTRVLIVDDDAYASDLMVGYLDSWGLRSENVDNPDLALDKLRSAINNLDPFQVVFIDLRRTSMTGTNVGLEVGRKILADERLNGTRLILGHDLDDVNSAKEALDIGFRAALSRPVHQSKLLDALAQVMAGRPAGDKRPLTISQEIAALAQKRAERRKELILVADDHPLNQQVTVLYLLEMGLEAHTVNNGQEAIAALADQQYALVLMDCQMPELDGLEATKKIRQSEAGTDRHIPIVAMTAHAMKGDRETCLAAGMDDYVSKPISELELKEVLDRWIPSPVQIPNVKHVPADVASAGGHEGQSAQGAHAEVRSAIASLRERFGNEEAGNLLEIFLTDSSATLKRLEQAVLAGNGDEAASVAHYMKGACSMLHANHMRQLCLQMEESAGQEDWEQVKHKRQLLEQSVAILRSCAREFATQERPSSGCSD